MERLVALDRARTMNLIRGSDDSRCRDQLRHHLPGDANVDHKEPPLPLAALQSPINVNIIIKHGMHGFLNTKCEIF